MKNNFILYFAGIIAIGFVFFYVFDNNEQNYYESITNQRNQYVDFLKNSSKSPLEKGQKFYGLNFYEADINYKVEARLEKNTKFQTIPLITNNTEPRIYTIYGTLHFTLNNSPCTLVLYQNTDEATDYFLPFADLTNGVETYETGRYLPVEMTSGETITLDFNQAFNPYCVYNNNYTCPMPPKENRLEISVLAGEKKYIKSEE